MTRNLERELKDLKKRFGDAKNNEIRIQTRLEEAKSRRKQAHENIKAKGYDVKTLPTVVKEKEKQLADTISEVKTYLPSEQSDDQDDFDYDE